MEENKCAGYTGFLDGFLSFEILEHLNDPSWGNHNSLPFNHLSEFKSFFEEDIVLDAILMFCTVWLIKKIEIKVGNPADVIYIDKSYLSQLEEWSWSLFQKSREMLTTYIKKKKAYVLLHIDRAAIYDHLDRCLEDWRGRKFFNNIGTSVNKLLPGKQEEAVLSKISEFSAAWIDTWFLILRLVDLFNDKEAYYELGDEFRCWGDPDLKINPFMALWSLKDKWTIDIVFWWVSLISRPLIAYRISVLENSEEQIPSKAQEIDATAIMNFLNKIEHCKMLAQRGLLETRREQDLLREMRSFNYGTLTKNEILLLGIKKLKSHPQTIWPSSSSRWFSSEVSRYIMDWWDMLKELLPSYVEQKYMKAPAVPPAPTKELGFDNGVVTKNGKELGRLKAWNAEYKLFKCLFDKLGETVTYEDLKKAIKPWASSDLPPKYCQKIKAALPEKIKKLIVPSGKGVGFVLRIK